MQILDKYYNTVGGEHLKAFVNHAELFSKLDEEKHGHDSFYF